MSDSELTFSIIVPTHKRPTELAQCLAAISKIVYPRELFNVIIVDDGATVSEQIAAPFREKLNIIWHAQTQTGPATARNNGVKLSEANFLFFLDDDCLPDENLLQICAEEFKKNANLMLGGKIINALPNNIYSSSSQLLVDFLYDYFTQNNSEIQFFTSNNLAISRENFQKINGFNESFPLPAGEDREFCWRWRELGGALQFVTDAKIFHAHRLNCREFWSQHFKYGRGAFHFHTLRAATDDGKIKFEPIKFYRTLLSFPFKTFGILRGIPAASLFVVSQIANVLGFLYQKFSRA